MPFRPEKFDLFRITSFDADPEGATALMHYALDDEHHFTERVDFGRVGIEGPVPPLSAGQRSAFEAVVRLLHLAAGVSYYKTAATRRIAIETGELSDAELRLCHDIYDRGLREFAYTNALEVPRHLEIVSTGGGSDLRTGPREAPRSGVAVPVGGGKDSIVVLEALKRAAGWHPFLVSVNPNPAVERIAAISELPLVRMTRKIDPLLLDLNEQGALNGHVPVTAIISLIAVAGGYLHGYDTTVMALEGSSDSPTRVLAAQGGSAGVETGLDQPEPDAIEVNHQWSKSAEFESQLQEVLRQSVHESIRYLSPLRRFDELEVARAFAGMSPYFSAFRSCNRAFRISDPFDGWCRDCPKCRFVFLALATVLSREQVVAIFGADLLDDISETEGFLDLLDHRRKPFECVGTVEEVAEAFSRLLDDHAWSGATVLDQIRPVLARDRGFDRQEPTSGSRVLSEIQDAVARTTLTRVARTDP